LDIEIACLADHADFIPTLARWHYEQWNYLSPGDSVERRIQVLSQHRCPSQIPTTLVAIYRGRVIGSASLVLHDMSGYRGFSPWLACVYVDPPCRGRGVGSSLVRHAVDKARALGIETLYLYTPDLERFYARMGWTVLERVEYRGYQQTVMSLHISSTNRSPTAQEESQGCTGERS